MPKRFWFALPTRVPRVGRKRSLRVLASGLAGGARANILLPLVNRMAIGFSNWLSPAYARGGRLPGGESPRASIESRLPQGAELLLKPDLDQVEALNPERDALWTRLEGVSFLTEDEKRAAAGYAATPRR
jgi:hypothetical protein